jgi:hypothetical protein
MVKSKSQGIKQSPSKNKKKVKSEKIKSIGLFDHVKHIRTVQDPNYYNNLSDSDRKSFNHFMILQVLSMDPQQLDVVSKYLYPFFDIIPSSQFYKLLISFIPKDSTYYPWIGHKNKYNEELVKLVALRFEISTQHSEEYINILFLTKEGIDSLAYICRGFGKSSNEIENLLSINDNDG